MLVERRREDLRLRQRDVNAMTIRVNAHVVLLQLRQVDARDQVAVNHQRCRVADGRLQRILGIG